MKRKVKKKGSTFLIVMVLMSLIFIVGTAILAVTGSDYKIRVSESKKLQNLYLADSGIETVEYIVVKTTQEAIKYADSKVKESILNNNNSAKNIENVKSKFEEEFYGFFNNKKSMNINGNEQQVEILKYLILENKYIEAIKEDSDGEIEEIDCGDIKKENDFKITIPEDGYKIGNMTIDNKEKKGIEISILSTFENKDEELKNKKTISTKYVIYAPDYNTQISQIDILPIYDKKAITIDGNLELKEGGNLKVDGDIWVKGYTKKLNEDSNFVFEKYKGGIVIERSNLNLIGNIYTGESLILRNSTESKIEGILYAKNLYLGKTIDGEYSSNNNITITRDVILNNDLALNDKNSIININGDFYGINDITDNSKIELSSENGDINKNVIRAINSSSIIVNECENSKINIGGAAYIMGVAYLDATDSEGNKYETGESVAIKGNYLAYNDVGEVDENTTLKYYGPLQLLEEDDVSDKANYIFNYYSGNNANKSYNFINGKDGNPIITIKKSDESLSVGASVDKDGNMVYESLINTPDNVKDKQEEFILNVLAMGDNTQIDDKLKYYNEVKVLVSDQIDIGDLYISKSNDDGTGFILVKNGDVTLTGDKEGLVIIDGNVIIEGKLNFSGAIIATGDITFKGSEDKSIKYDANVIKDILAENKELQNIFKVNNSTSSEIRINSDSGIYNKENFLKTSSWKIEK